MQLLTIISSQVLVFIIKLNLFVFFFLIICNLNKVLTLTDLSLTLGETYKVEWDSVSADYQRVDCHPEANADEAKCTQRGCLWNVRSLSFLDNIH